ncbi:MAG: S46 family peptidase [Acidobacteriota bacterium]
MQAPQRTSTAVFLAVILVFAVSAAPLSAVEGKWTPEQILAHDPAWLAELGLEIAPQELWKAAGGGLLEAIVQINGCSAGFVSDEGLLITNHHCIFSILQEHSTPERDLIDQGFLAVDRSDELPATGMRAQVPVRFEDVTEAVMAAVPAGADDGERFEAVERRRKELVAECETENFRRCRVATYDGGVRIVRIEAIELRDARLVYAPPRWVGEFGGEVDNWSWPRHAGDFALVRIYAGENNAPAEKAASNVPYRPRRSLEVAPGDLARDDFVMVVGYPGRTFRSQVAAEMEETGTLYFPRRSALFRDRIALMKAASEEGEEARIALADRIKSLENAEKNGRGQVAGLERGQILDKKRSLEERYTAWAESRTEEQEGLAALGALTEAAEANQAAGWQRDFLLGQVRSGPLAFALTLGMVRGAQEAEKPDIERRAGYQERDRPRRRTSHERNQKRIHPPTERALMLDWLTRAAALPADQRLASIDALVKGDETNDASVAAAVETLYADTGLMDLETRLELFDLDLGALEERAKSDPLLAFAFALTGDLKELEERENRRAGAELRLRPAWRRSLERFLGRPLDPDANGTLRVSLAHVKGYSPRDAVWMEPFTTLAGLIQKHTGEDPFDAPKSVREAAPESPASRWAAPFLKDVPVGFLATGDTTGGSSGSPVLDGRGRLVGVNFDRVWENIANDFGYNPEIARNVSADVRYMLWMLESVAGEGAAALLEELGVSPPDR